MATGKINQITDARQRSEAPFVKISTPGPPEGRRRRDPRNFGISTPSSVTVKLSTARRPSDNRPIFSLRNYKSSSSREVVARTTKSNRAPNVVSPSVALGKRIAAPGQGSRRSRAGAPIGGPASRPVTPSGEASKGPTLCHFPRKAFFRPNRRTFPGLGDFRPPLFFSLTGPEKPKPTVSGARPHLTITGLFYSPIAPLHNSGPPTHFARGAH